MKKILALVLAVCALLALSACGTAKEGGDVFPDKALTVIVPYSAGGSCDIVTRKLAALMEKELGQPITVLNQGGSTGAIGIQACLDAESDGYTMVMTADSLGTLRVMGLSETIDYTDFAPVTAVLSDPKVIVVDADSKYETLGDLMDDMKQRPGKVKMSYTGPGGSGHIQSLILNALGCDMALTAYPGGSDGLIAVLSGQVDFTNANYSTVISYLESGELRCLAACSAERIAAIPEVPTIVEAVPEAEQYLRFPFTPFVLQVKNDVDADKVDTLRAAAARALGSAEWSDFAGETCQEKLYERYKTPEETAAFLGGYESMVSWMLYDAGAAQLSPEQFGIARP